MVTLKNISKKLDNFQINNISFDLPSGYIMGVIGENGAGKTTLIKILSGLYVADQGEYFVNEMNYQESEGVIKQDIGIVIHDNLFDKNSSLLKNAQHYGRFYQNYDSNLLIRYTEKFCLDVRKKHKHLSKGEKLKFALAFALSHQPKILLLDEPSANFDTDFRAEFDTILRNFTSTGQNSVILSTHITSDIDKYADYVLYLQKGTLELYGDIESIRAHYRMVSGETYKIKLLKDRIIHMEEGNYGTKALVLTSSEPFDSMLKFWEPSMEEIMYFMSEEKHF